MSTPPPIPKTQNDYMESVEKKKRERRERCQNPNRFRNIRKKE
jgi:hypothetical protein